MKTHTHARHIRLMGFDVDGVLTDGRLYFTPNGEEIKAFSSLDGHGLKMLMSAGIEVAIITARSSRMVELRMQNLGITELCQGIEDKLTAMQQLCKRKGLELSQVGYMGDDLLDLPVLSSCGFSASVPEGYGFVQQNVDYVTRRQAGQGAVREVCDVILASQGKLDTMLASYLRNPGQHTSR